MARRGRPRKDATALLPPNREPNGRLARSSVIEQIKDAGRKQEQKEMAVVLAQPHRQGNNSQLAESVLGRFCLAHRLNTALYDSGIEYGGMKRRWIAVMGGRLPDRIEGNGWANTDMNDAARWLKRINEMEAAIVRGNGSLRAIEAMAVYEMKPSVFVSNDFIIKGLLALAIECGRLTKSDKAR